jgi:hypothetical protein
LKENTLTPTHAGTIAGGGRRAAIYEKISGEALAILFRNNTGLSSHGSWGVEGVKLKYVLAGQAKE